MPGPLGQDLYYMMDQYPNCKHSHFALYAFRRPICEAYVVGKSESGGLDQTGEEIQMTMTQRVLLAAVIVLVDLAAVFLPLTAIFLAYVFVFNPPWFRDMINRLDGPV